MIAEDLSQIARTCACFHFRRTSRAVTNFFNRTLRPAGLTSSQFVALLVTALSDEITMSRMADALGMDRTTLSRQLAPLRKRQLLELTSGNDKRTQIATLTERGKAALAQGVPYWREAQSKIVGIFGEKNWEALLKELDKTSRL